MGALCIFLDHVTRDYFPSAQLGAKAATMTLGQAMGVLQQMNRANVGSLTRCCKTLREKGVTYATTYLALRLRFMATSPAVINHFKLTLSPVDLPLSIVRFLVEGRNAMGRTNLMRAAQDPSRVEQLISWGADVNAQNVVGHRALGITRNVVVARHLIAAKADVNALVCGAPLLAFAAATNRQSMMRCLIDAKAHINAVGGEHCWPALAFAADFGHVGAVQLLLEAKADQHSKDTGLREATASGQIEIVRMLLEARANPNANNGKLSAWTIAIRTGKTNIVALFKQGTPQ
jgi:hypothetical protein